MRPVEGGGGGGLVSARPEALRRFAARAGGRVAGVQPAAARLGPALERLRAGAGDPAFAVRLPAADLGGEITTLLGEWTEVDAMVERVAAAFERADLSGGGGLALADPGELGRRLRAAGYNPLGALVKGGKGAPDPLARCFPDGYRYDGGGYVRGPDGRLWPLVVPVLPGKGRPYQEVDGRGDAGSLDGRDPGWVVVGDYRGIGPLESTSLGERLAAAGVALTGGAVPSNAAPKKDYAGLRYGIGGGRPYWVEGGKAFPAPAGGVPNPSPELKPRGRVPETGGAERAIPPTRGTAGAAALGLAVNAVHAMDQVGDAHVGAYQLLLERNLDGRRRARLVQIRMGVADDGETRVIQPQYVHLDERGRKVVTAIRYRGHPDPNVAEATEVKGKSRIWDDG
jgi:hypothetical protein